jgi:hypothetical protein
MYIMATLYVHNGNGISGIGYIYTYSFLIKIFFRSQTTTRMAGGSLGRSHSMLDLSQRDRSLLECEPAPSSSSGLSAGSSAGAVPTTGKLMTESRSTSTLFQPSAAEGLILLGEKTNDMDVVMSPESYGDVVQHLLDYDSDTGIQADSDSGRLSVRDVQQTTSTSTSELETDRSEQVPPNMDAVYYQCNAIRSSCRKETLTSVSSDTSYGKTVTMQSPSIGSFPDHEGLITRG